MGEVEEGGVAAQTIKERAGEFSLDNVVTLMMRGDAADAVPVAAPGAIVQCKNLAVLDLANNRLSGSLEQFCRLESLSVLKVAGNRLTSLRGLDSMLQLRELDAAGNAVAQLDDVLGSAESGLECLALKDLDGSRPNPVVTGAGYVEAVRRRFPNLRKLDGRRLHGGAAEFYEECMAFEEQLVSGRQASSPVKEEPWFKGQALLLDTVIPDLQHSGFESQATLCREALADAHANSGNEAFLTAPGRDL